MITGVKRRCHIWQVDHLMGMVGTVSTGCRTWTHLILCYLTLKKVLSNHLFIFFEEKGDILVKFNTNRPQEETYIENITADGRQQDHNTWQG